MKRYVAELTELTLAWLCAAVNHAGGCWITNTSPLRHLDRWAMDVQYPMADHAKGLPCDCGCEPATQTRNTTAATSATYFVQWPTRGTPCS